MSGRLWLVLVGFVALQAPFLAAPFRVDEPNIIAIARQIAEAPADPYGFEINWLGTEEPAWQVLRNPPLIPYWLAGWAGLFGWSEVSLHVSMLVWALVAMIATAGLSERVDLPGWAGAGLVASSVAFFVSAPLLMPDVAALALSAVAILLALRDDRMSLIIGVLAAGAAPMAKYTALALVVPLALISLRRRTPGAFAILAAPFLSLVLWSQASKALYGTSHLLASAGSQGGIKLVAVPILVLLGLAVFPLSLLGAGAPRRRTLVASLAAGALAFPLLRFLTENSVGSALAGAAGIAVATMVLTTGFGRAIRHPSLERLAGLAWLLTTIALAFTYQFITSRYLLGAAVAVVILMGGPIRSRLAPILVAAGILISLAVASADVRHASIYRTIAGSVIAGEDRPVWLVGHWGFQHYGVEAGGRMLDLEGEVAPEPGDLILLSEATFPGIELHRLLALLGAEHLETVAVESSWPLRTQACAATISFHGAGASSCENAFRVAIPWGFSAEPLDRIHRLRVRSHEGATN